jgi:hypothetical protein
VEDATQWMRILGGLAVVAPMLLGRIPAARRYARPIARIAAVLYLLVGIGFVLWWVFIRPRVAG